jgi:hypothetical protein
MNAALASVRVFSPNWTHDWSPAEVTAMTTPLRSVGPPESPWQVPLIPLP